MGAVYRADRHGHTLCAWPTQAGGYNRLHLLLCHAVCHACAHHPPFTGVWGGITVMQSFSDKFFPQQVQHADAGIATSPYCLFDNLVRERGECFGGGGGG